MSSWTESGKPSPFTSRPRTFQKAEEAGGVEMSETGHILQWIRDKARIRILYLPHAVRQMSRPDRMITVGEVRAVVLEGELIEDYPEDPRGHSALLLGRGSEGRAIHVVCSPKDEYLAVITAYLPNAQQWTGDFRERRGK